MSIRKRIKESLVQALGGIFDELFLFESENIFRWRQNRALEQTGLFIEEHLPFVHSFETRYALFDYILKAYSINEKDGLVCEFGVATGKSLNFLARKLKNKTLFGFDSFKGLPEDWRGNYPKGTFKTALPPVRDNAILIPGLFDETFGPFLQEHKEKALLLHVDCDLYSSTKTVFEFSKASIVPGTILIFDEFFNYPGWQEGESKAFFEFTDNSKLHFEYIAYNCLGTQLAVQITE